MMSATASVPDAPERAFILPYIEQDNVYASRPSGVLKVDPTNPNSPAKQQLFATRLMEEEGIFYF